MEQLLFAMDGMDDDRSHGAKAHQPEIQAIDLKGKVVYVVDANSLIFQVYHALPEMTSPKGEHVNAVFGFTRDILFLWEQKKPDFLFFAFDTSEPTFRHQLVDDYKGKRDDLPIDLAPQFEKIYRVTEALGLPVLTAPGFEADDILATLARISRENQAHCYLVTGDKDCRQLLCEWVHIYNIRKNEMYNAESLAKDWGIRPDQVVDFQSLVGDSVDNIQGVPLVGPKVAAEWLTKFDTLEKLIIGVYQLPPGKRRENLREAIPRLPLVRKLVELDTNVPVPIDWNAAKPGRVNHVKAEEAFSEFGFHSFKEKLNQLSRRDTPICPDWSAKYRAIATLAELEMLVQDIRKTGKFSLDTETTHIHPRWAEIVGISIACTDDEGVYIPIRAPHGSAVLDLQDVLKVLKPILEDPHIGKVGQNLKYDLIVLKGLGVEVQGVIGDTLIASFLLDAGERAHNLDELAKRYLQHENIKIEQLIGTGKQQKRMDQVPLAEITDYAGEDALVAWKLAHIFEPLLEERNLAPLFQATELPLVEVLVDLEYLGISLDIPRLEELRVVFTKKLAALEEEIHAIAGFAFNIASPKQLADILFKQLNLPVVKRTKTGPSTDADVLEELAEKHPLPAKVVEYRQYAKLLGTYVEALPQMVHPKTQRVHCSLHQAVASTGRLSSSDPNLQNIPVRTEEGRQIRSAFKAGPPGWLLLAADYSQIELRILAHFCGDETLLRAFEEDLDIHRLVAAQVNNVSMEAVTSDMRRAAKAVNFGVIYGQTPFGLAKQLGISKQEAGDFIDAYFGKYPGVLQFIDDTLAQCREQGYVTTILGRRRAIEGIRSDSGLAKSKPVKASARQLNLPERTAVNTVIQGSAADLIKQAMIKIHQRLRDEPRWQGKMLLQIHDELLFEAPREEIPELGLMVQAEMAGVMHLNVPIKVDLKSGPNWSECEGW